ncbi:TMEM165/GDT1 family protein [Trichormus azollae]|jgi:putative Ca2+/H+ antiporter (TMEM165/GDT1 family)|uniref:GDT1 family protein n=1 Tax=Nostoc azollae (strain 0708) TaxID=551115 RepID=D7E0K3_NOSA0|nr:TMEM165/GDT1 family protein [Trichormus azollae]ADI64659.1 protein of unknown function UPF0016 ['Nostoc azollae' 0708]
MLTAFTAGLVLITISELGDKTFFLTVVLSMQHPRRVVFAGVTAALGLMTILSVIFGQLLSAVTKVPKIYIHYTEIVLFIAFGLKLLYDASKMSVASDTEVIEEAKEAVEKVQLDSQQKSLWSILLKSFVLTLIAEWGDRTQIATIALAASYNPIGITVGAILGHAICAAIAVIGGRLIAGKISERQITFIGGLLFIIFGIVATIEGS